MIGAKNLNEGWGPPVPQHLVCSVESQYLMSPGPALFGRSAAKFTHRAPIAPTRAASSDKGFMVPAFAGEPGPDVLPPAVPDWRFKSAIIFQRGIVTDDLESFDH